MFPFGSATLTPEGREALRGLASGFTAPDADYTTILVEGHTCSIGPEDYNRICPNDAPGAWPITWSAWESVAMRSASSDMARVVRSRTMRLARVEC
jgi:hypothetical protein